MSRYSKSCPSQTADYIIEISEWCFLYVDRQGLCSSEMVKRDRADRGLSHVDPSTLRRYLETLRFHSNRLVSRDDKQAEINVYTSQKCEHLKETCEFIESIFFKQVLADPSTRPRKTPRRGRPTSFAGHRWVRLHKWSLADLVGLWEKTPNPDPDAQVTNQSRDPNLTDEGKEQWAEFFSLMCEHVFMGLREVDNFLNYPRREQIRIAAQAIYNSYLETDPKSLHPSTLKSRTLWLSSVYAHYEKVLNYFLFFKPHLSQDDGTKEQPSSPDAPPPKS